MSTTSARTEAAEDTIVRILTEVLFLKQATINRAHTFLDTGLDSILAVEFVVALRKEFDAELTIETLYAYPKPGLLARYLTGGNAEQAG